MAMSFFDDVEVTCVGLSLPLHDTQSATTRMCANDQDYPAEDYRNGIKKHVY